MGIGKISRMLASTAFAVAILGATGIAQTMPTIPSNRGITPPNRTNTTANGQHNGVERNPACQRIIAECKKLGFIQGQWKEDNGLWRDCFDPVVKGGGHPTRDGKPISVPVSQADVQACRNHARAR